MNFTLSELEGLEFDESNNNFIDSLLEGSFDKFRNPSTF